MVSPIFVAYAGSPWRDHVQATWKYLHQNYTVTSDRECATHVHISVQGGYSFEEIKRVARSVIHFEPAIDALVPPERRGGECEWAKSSWLDSEHLALENRSRDRSMDFFDTVTDFYSFLSVMNPEGERGYSWNFRSIQKYYTIEFREPPASTTVDQVLSWAEFAMSFIQASIEHGLPEKLRIVPSTIGGLSWFLEQGYVDGMNDHDRLKTLWADKEMNEFVEPKAMRLYLSPEETQNIERERKLDKGQIKVSKMTRKAPYWR
jgi:Putative amidoligase enzyme